MLGWLRSKSGRSVGRAIVALSEEEQAHEDRREDFRRLGNRQQWEQIRDSIDAVHESVQRVIWELGEVKRDLARSEAAREKDNVRLNDAISDLTYVRAQLEHVRAHCDRCPAGNGGLSE